MQVIAGLCFSTSTFNFPLKSWLNKTQALAHAVNTQVFLAQGLLAEEFGCNGPVCDAVAKKPWLASVSPFAVRRVPPQWNHSCFSLSASLPAQPRGACDQMEREDNALYFLTTAPLAFQSLDNPACLLHVPAAYYVFTVWGLLCCIFSGHCTAGLARLVAGRCHNPARDRGTI